MDKKAKKTFCETASELAIMPGKIQMMRPIVEQAELSDHNGDQSLVAMFDHKEQLLALKFFMKDCSPQERMNSRVDLSADWVFAEEVQWAGESRSTFKNKMF